MDNNYFGNICYCRKCNGIIHTIKNGDTLYLLSRYYNVPIGEIQSESVEEPFDKSILMSDLIKQKDMTFEKFLTLIQN